MVKATRAAAAKRTTSRAVAARSSTRSAAAKPAGSASDAVATPSRGRAASKAAAKGAVGTKRTAKAAASPARGPAASAAKRASSASARASKPVEKASKAGANGKAGSAATSQCAPVDLGYLSGFVGFHLRLAQDASYRAFARYADKDMVKPGRYPALAIIHLNPGISQSALGRAIARDKSTVSPLIKDLQNNGFISRKPSPSDRRSVTLALTKKGERVLERLHVRALDHEVELDKIIGSAKGRLVAVLDKITGGLALA